MVSAKLGSRKRGYLGVNVSAWSSPSSPYFGRKLKPQSAEIVEIKERKSMGSQSSGS